MLFVFLLSDCKYLLYFWLRECLKVLFIIQSINMLESINNLHILLVFSRYFSGRRWRTGARLVWGRAEPGGSSAHPGLGEEHRCFLWCWGFLCLFGDFEGFVVCFVWGFGWLVGGFWLIGGFLRFCGFFCWFFWQWVVALQVLTLPPPSQLALWGSSCLEGCVHP